MAVWHSTADNNGGYRYYANAGNELIFVSIINPTRVGIRRRALRLNRQNGNFEHAPGSSYEYLLKDNTAPPSNTWTTNSAVTAEIDRGSGSNADPYIVIMGANWGDPVSIDNDWSLAGVAYDFWVKDIGHTGWGTPIRLYACPDPGCRRASTYTPSFNTFQTRVDEGSPWVNLTDNQPLDASQQLRIRWNHPHGEPHFGYQRIRLARDIPGSRQWYRGDLASRSFDAGVYTYADNDGFATIPAFNWNDSYEGSITFVIYIERDWDGAISGTSAGRRVTAVQDTTDPDALPNLTGPTINITPQVGNAGAVLRWDFGNDELNATSFSKIILERREQLIGPTLLERISVANPPRWNTVTHPSTNAPSVSTDGQFLRLGAGWAVPGRRYSFRARLYSSQYDEISGNDGWSPWGSYRYYDIEGATPTAPTFAVHQPEATSTTYDPESDIEFRITVPSHQVGHNFKLRRSTSENSGPYEYWSGTGELQNQWVSDSSAIALDQTVSGGFRADIELPENEWQDPETTWYYSAQYEEDDNDWSHYSSTTRIETHAGLPPRPTISSPANNTSHNIRSILNIDFIRPAGMRYARLRRYDINEGRWEYRVGGSWTTTAPTGNAGRIDPSYVASPTGTRRITLSTRWDDGTPRFNNYSIQLQRTSDSLWSPWSNNNLPRGVSLKSIVPKLGMYGVRQSGTYQLASSLPSDDPNRYNIDGTLPFDLDYTMPAGFGNSDVDRIAIKQRVNNNGVITDYWLQIESGEFVFREIPDQTGLSGVSHSGGIITLPSAVQPNDTVATYFLYFWDSNNRSEVSDPIILDANRDPHPAPTWITTSHSATYHGSLRLRWNAPAAGQTGIELRLAFDGAISGTSWLESHEIDTQGVYHATYNITDIQRIIYRDNNSIILPAGWAFQTGRVDFYLKYIGSDNHISDESSRLRITVTDGNPTAARFTNVAGTNIAAGSNGPVSHNTSESLTFRWSAPGVYDRVRIRRRSTIGGPTPEDPDAPAIVVDQYLSSLLSVENPQDVWSNSSESFIRMTASELTLTAGWAVPGQTVDYYISYKQGNLYKWSAESTHVRVNASVVEDQTLTNVTAYDDAMILVRFLENNNRVYAAISRTGTRLAISPEQRYRIDEVIGQNDELPYLIGSEIFYVDNSGISAKDINNGSSRVVVRNISQRVIDDFVLSVDGSYAVVSRTSTYDQDTEITEYVKYSLPNWDNEHYFARVGTPTNRPETNYVVSNNRMYWQRGSFTYRVVIGDAEVNEDGETQTAVLVNEPSRLFNGGTSTLNLLGISNNYVYYADDDNTAPFISRVHVDQTTNATPISVRNNVLWGSLPSHQKYFAISEDHLWMYRLTPSTVLRRKTLPNGASNVYYPITSTFDIDDAKLSPPSAAITTTTAPTADTSGLLDQGMVVYMYTVGTGTFSTPVFGAIDQNGQAITFSDQQQQSFRSLGSGLPEILYGDTAIFTLTSSIVSRNVGTGSLASTSLYSTDSYLKTLRALTASADNVYAYVLEIEHVLYQNQQLPIRIKLLRFDLPDVNNYREILDFSSAIISSGQVNTGIKIRNLRIYADHNYIFVSMNRYNSTISGDFGHTYVFKIPTGLHNSSHWTNYVQYEAPPGNVRDPLRGLSGNPDGSSSTDQYYMTNSSGDWLSREDSSNDSRFSYGNDTAVFENAPYGSSLEPIVTSWHIWVADALGRQITKYSRFGAEIDEYTVLPSGRDFTFAKWYAPRGWRPTDTAIPDGLLDKPVWISPPPPDATRQWNQDLTVTWENNLTGTQTQHSIRMYRTTLTGGGLEYLSFVSDTEVRWRPLGVNEEEGPVIEHTSESMTWPTPWQPDNAARRYIIQVITDDGDETRESDPLILRTTDAVTNTLDFNKGLLAVRKGPTGASGVYGVYDFNDDFVNYTTNREAFGVFQERLSQDMDKVTYGNLDDVQYVYQPYGNPRIGYPLENPNHNKVRRFGFEDSSIRAPDIYESSRNFVTAITRNMNSNASNFNKIYTMDFDTGNDRMYIVEHELPDMTNHETVYSGPFIDDNYGLWWHMTASDTHVYLSRNDVSNNTISIYRVKTDRSSTSLEGFKLSSTNAGYDQIAAYGGYVYGIDISSRNIVRMSEGSLNPNTEDVATGNFNLFKLSPWFFWAHDSSSEHLYRFNLDGSNRETVFFIRPQGYNDPGTTNEVVQYMDVHWPDDWTPTGFETIPTLNDIDKMYLFYTYTGNNLGVIDYLGVEHTIPTDSSVRALSSPTSFAPPRFHYGNEIYFLTNTEVIAVNVQNVNADRIALEVPLPTAIAPSHDSSTVIRQIAKPNEQNVAYTLESTDADLKVVKYRLPLFDERTEIATLEGTTYNDYQTMVASDAYVYIARWNVQNYTPILRIPTNEHTTFPAEWIRMDGENSVTLSAAHNDYVYGKQTSPYRVFRINTFGHPNPSTVITLTSGTNFDVHVTPSHVWQVDTTGNDIVRTNLVGSERTVFTPIASNQDFGFSSVIWPHRWMPGSTTTSIPTNVEHIVPNPLPDGARVFKWEHPISTSLDWTISLQATLLDANLNSLEDITDLLIPEECSVQYDVSRRIRNTAVLAFNRNRDWFQYKVKLTMTVTDNETGESRHDHLGVYVIETVQTSYDEDDEDIICQAYDLFAAMDTPIGFDYTVDEGTSYPDAIKQVFDDMASWYGEQAAQPVDRAGIETPVGVPYSVSYGSGSSPPLVIGTRVWMTNQSYTWLSVIETLAKEANYRKPWITRDGVVTVDESKDFAATIVLPVDEYNVIAPEVERVQDGWGTPNQWIMLAETADPDVPLPAGEETTTTYVRTNLIENTFSSYQNRGRRIIRSVQTWATVAKSQQELDDKFEQQARRLIQEDIIGGDRVKFSMVPNPGLWHGDVIRLSGIIEGDWLVQKWSLPFDSSNMTVEAVKIITDWTDLV